ncbi:MAG: site-specific integrase [Firmicutes bacterium HGW-Firmicutes-7]|nr:MAG: site-specific integrase [Firmicutes bacterium HGW-Firmicutes-7]
MAKVDPIRDLNLLKDILNNLRETNMRNYIMFSMGVHTGLRISDILTFKIGDVLNRDKVIIKEKKTQKPKEFSLNKRLQKDIKEYAAGKYNAEYLIKSRTGFNSPITRNQAYQIIQNVSKEFKIENVGTHTLRKTFAYHYYMKTKDIAELQTILNHANQADTLMYIGILQEKINKNTSDFDLF